ncbi:hypothetical protein [Planctellipticum variicoloris]|uniref:hypothetical protein n=1 Tax=Planctellipticum variicoloris TaxID=3064265 RepID=UPI00301338EA|nr:hypothetical protein SH412_003278 [Planctomycetaceae bacterium SH412]
MPKRRPRTADPTAAEIAAQAYAIRRAEPFLSDGRRRDGYDLAALVAETSIRQSAQALQTWGRLWQVSRDRLAEDDCGNNYRRTLEPALLALEWVEEMPTTDSTLLSFPSACSVLGCTAEAVREVVIYPGLASAARLWLAAIAGIEHAIRERPAQPTMPVLTPTRRNPLRRKRSTAVSDVPTLGELSGLRRAIRAGHPLDEHRLTQQLSAAVRSPADHVSSYAAETWRELRYRKLKAISREPLPSS